jgi:hypothetical protein
VLTDRDALLTRLACWAVCDDIALAQKCRARAGEAREAGVPMLISTGVWPGISSLSTSGHAPSRDNAVLLLP